MEENNVASYNPTVILFLEEPNLDLAVLTSLKILAIMHAYEQKKKDLFSLPLRHFCRRSRHVSCLRKS